MEILRASLGRPHGTPGHRQRNQGASSRPRDFTAVVLASPQSSPWTAVVRSAIDVFVARLQQA
ncbi:MAG: hypothetical protein IPO19_15230 [Rhodoferax sp.]|nr:hypothetical protein [Rhodoferax sp.]